MGNKNRYLPAALYQVSTYGIHKARILVALHGTARIRAGYPVSSRLTIPEAKILLRTTNKKFISLRGVLLYLDLSGDSFDSTEYDRIHAKDGEDLAQNLVQSLREQEVVVRESPAPLMQSKREDVLEWERFS